MKVPPSKILFITICGSVLTLVILIAMVSISFGDASSMQQVHSEAEILRETNTLLKQMQRLQRLNENSFRQILAIKDTSAERKLSKRDSIISSISHVVDTIRTTMYTHSGIRKSRESIVTTANKSIAVMKNTNIDSLAARKINHVNELATAVRNVIIQCETTETNELPAIVERTTNIQAIARKTNGNAQLQMRLSVLSIVVLCITIFALVQYWRLHKKHI